MRILRYLLLVRNDCHCSMSRNVSLILLQIIFICITLPLNYCAVTQLACLDKYPQTSKKIRKDRHDEIY